ncbi:unnamed protein product, partial [Vitis vinifera]|uniref:Uncharacterized protein n=1 Tax=Vitis vinifera TaxID=29760 RepID=D7SNT5_VITVI
MTWVMTRFLDMDMCPAGYVKEKALAKCILRSASKHLNQNSSGEPYLSLQTACLSLRLDEVAT